MRLVTLAVSMTAALIAASAGSAAEDGKKWYLMEPPVDETSSFGHGVLDEAPLSQWKRIATYATQMACESKRNEAVQASRDETARLAKTGPLPPIEIFKGAYRDSRLAGVSTCVSADDPRLTSGFAR